MMGTNTKKYIEDLKLFTLLCDKQIEVKSKSNCENQTGDDDTGDDDTDEDDTGENHNVDIILDFISRILPTYTDEQREKWREQLKIDINKLEE